MKAPIVIIGIGEMAGVFARGFLRLGHPVYPVTRQSGDLTQMANQIPRPALVLVAVGENDLASVLEAMPDSWSDRLGLLQNELLPKDFTHLEKPTVISVWFEKKKGREAKVIIPSPVFGPGAKLLVAALATVDISACEVEDLGAMTDELVIKNLYILTSNIAGLRVGGSVGELWEKHSEQAKAVAMDIALIQEGLTGKALDRDRLLQGMLEAFNGDPDHQCMGRSAPQRLARALEHADQLSLDVPVLREISRETNND